MKTRFFLGEWRSGDKPVTPFEANELCQLAHARRKELESYPVDRVLSLLQDLGKLWSDPGFSLRQECEAELPGVTGFSEKMIRQSIASISRVLDRNGLERKLERELRGIRRGQWNSQPSSRTRITFQPLGVVLHILSGNVFLVGLSSLIEGLITGNITLLKQSSDEQFFLPRLIKSIESIDVDGVITRSIALVDYSSTDHGVIQVFKRSVDGIVVWGGEEAVQAYRNDLPARTKVIVYGPKLSLAIVTEKGLQEKTLPWISHQLAKEMAVWDQSACTAPQMVFIENERNVEPLGSSLVSALKNMETVLPAGAASVDTAIEIQKLRMVAEIAEIKNEGRCWGPENSISHTVYSSRDKAIEPSPLHRTIKICAFGTVKDILVQMEEMRGYLQTVGLGVAKSEVSPLASHLTQAGILRIVELGEMANGEIDDPHDGAFDLSQFGNFVFQRDRDEPVFWEERLGEVERKLLLEQKLREVVQIARSSSYYGPRLQGLVINSLVDLQKIPVLSRKDMEEQADPTVNGLCTRSWSGGYVTRSGGSTGKPKFSVYDGSDWEALVSNAIRVLAGAGLKKGDRVANCMLAGDLYGSFVSFDHINCRVGATSFAFAGELKTDVFLQTWKQFKINVIEAIPTVLMPLLRQCKKIEPAFEIETVIFGGQPLSPADRKWIQSECGAKRISSVIGANDGGQIGFQCEYCQGTEHHVIDDYNFIEIVDEKGQSLPEGAVGKMLITSLQKLSFPLLRYEIGDSGRFLSEPCKCGRMGRRIEYLGRTDDMLSVGLMNVNYRDIQQALSHLPISLFQLIAFSDDQGESIRLVLETDSQNSELSNEIKKAMLSGLPKIQEAMRKKSLVDIEVHIKKPGEIPRDSRTGKVRLVIDERL